MAKKISQATFDVVVLENILEFEMEPEEALKDASDQFQAQGIELSLIIKDASLYADVGEDRVVGHLIIKATESLKECVKGDCVTWDSAIPTLEVFSISCDEGIAQRCLAGANGAYPALLEVLRCSEDDEAHLLVAINAACSLCNGQPDLLDPTGRTLFMKFLEKYQDSTAVLEPLLRLIRYTCHMHEMNRQAYVDDKLIPQLTDVLDKHTNERAIVLEICAIFRSLTTDDDVRVPFGKAHEHAKMLVLEAGSLQKIVNICRVYSEDASVLGELFLTLSKLAVRNEFCQEIQDLGGLDLLIQVMLKNASHQTLMKQVLTLLKTIGGNDDVKIATVKAGGIEQTLEIMAKYAKSAGIAEAGCAALQTVCLRQPEHCTRVMAAGGADTIIKAMRIHPTSVHQ